MSKIIALFHFTRIENLNSIVQDDGLLTAFETFSKKEKPVPSMQFGLNQNMPLPHPGVYTTAINQSFENKKIPFFVHDKNLIGIMLTPRLLERKDFHASVFAGGGFAYGRFSTMGYDHLDIFNSLLTYRKEGGDLYNEVIFHHAIPLMKYMLNVIVPTKKIMKMLPSCLQDKAILTQKYPVIEPDKRKIKIPVLKKLNCLDIVFLNSHFFEELEACKPSKLEKKDMEALQKLLNGINQEMGQMMIKRYKTLKYKKGMFPDDMSITKDFY